MAEQGFNQQYKKVERIEQLDKVGPSATQLDVSATEEVSAPTKVKFEEAVAKADSKWDLAHQKTMLVATEEAPTKPSPITEMSLNAHRIERLKPVTVDQIVQQASDVKATLKVPVQKIEEVQKANPDIKIKSAHDAILTDKLIHVDSSLKTVLSKAGVEVKAQDLQLTGQKPLVKFLNMLSSSDRQLNSLIGEIQGLGAKRLTPDKLMAIQMKLNLVSQQLEFFTNVLNKAVEGTKTLMNVQV